MSNENERITFKNSENERITFSGGEVRVGEPVLRGTEVWNRDPLPKPPPPKQYTYKLTTRHAGGSQAVGVASTMEALIKFELQMRELGYEFIKLERLDE